MQLHHFTQKDCALLKRFQYANMTDNEVIQHINSWNSMCYGDYFFEMFAITVAEQIIGMISLHQRSKNELSLAIKIFTPFRGCGFATHAMTMALKGFVIWIFSCIFPSQKRQ